MKKLFYIIFCFIFVIVPAQKLGSSNIPETLKTNLEIFQIAEKMDRIIQAEMKSREAIQQAYSMDQGHDESIISDTEIQELDIISLYNIDKELVIKKMQDMKRHERRDLLKEAIVHFARQYKVKPNLIKAIAKAESLFDPYAKSEKWAYGVMQLIKPTARKYGVQNIYNPIENIEAGVRYFKDLLDQFDGNVKYALAAYNAGPNKVIRYKGVPPYSETRLYVKKVFKFYKKYEKTEPC